MYYTIYKITNKINGKVYIGSHKTRNLDDNYMGSGKYLLSAIKKHGSENFTKEILFVFDNPEEMYAKEAELVNEDFLAEANTYNLKKGGFGGFDYINSAGINGTLQGVEKSRQLKETDPEWRKMRSEQCSRAKKEKDKETPREVRVERAKKAAQTRLEKYGYLGTMTGKKHTEESKRKTGAASAINQAGSKNSQFGTTWVWSEEHGNKKIKKDDLEAYLANGWIKAYKPGYVVKKK